MNLKLSSSPTAVVSSSQKVAEIVNALKIATFLRRRFLLRQETVEPWLQPQSSSSFYGVAMTGARVGADAGVPFRARPASCDRHVPKHVNPAREAAERGRL